MKEYNDIEWLWVRKIVRTDETHVEVRRDSYITIYEFDSPSQCLEHFLYLKNTWREAYAQEWQIKPESKSSKRFFELRKRGY